MLRPSAFSSARTGYEQGAVIYCAPAAGHRPGTPRGEEAEPPSSTVQGRQGVGVILRESGVMSGAKSCAPTLPLGVVAAAMDQRRAVLRIYYTRTRKLS